MPEFRDNLAAQAWLWKDHTAHAEAAEITEKAARRTPHAYLAKCGGTYSSEWYWSKILHCRRTAPKVFAAAYSWVELADFIPAFLTGNCDPDTLPRGICAAGHKAMYNDALGRAARASEFLARLDPALAALRDRYAPQAVPADQQGRRADRRRGRQGRPAAGHRRGRRRVRRPHGRGGRGHQARHAGEDHRHQHLRHDGRPGRPRAAGHPRPVRHRARLDPARHVRPGGRAIGRGRHLQLVRQVPGAGRRTRPQGDAARRPHAARPRRLRPGESGLLALDWNNGNRTILVDPLLSGLLVGQTLHTTAAEVYRALVEATAFGALTIINRLEEYGVAVKEVVNCGGIAEKNPFVMQIYADVCNRPMKISRSAQTCALGAAIFGAVAGGAYKTVQQAQRKMTGVKDRVYRPNRGRGAGPMPTCTRSTARLHDAFGMPRGHAATRTRDERPDRHPPPGPPGGDA